MLGYATTIHGAQGSTADTSHTVLTGTETRQQLYVALTRGRDGNHVHLALPASGDEHSPITRDTLVPPTATELLERIIATDDTQQSATSQLRDLTRPDRQLREAITRYRDALDLAPRHAHTLEASRPLPWLPDHPDLPDDRGDYLTARARQITDLAQHIAATTDPPRRLRWEDDITAHDPTLAADLTVWQATHPRVPSHSHLGSPGNDPAESAHHRQLIGRIRHLVHQADPVIRWHEIATAIDPRLTNNHAWHHLAGAIEDAHHRGYDVRTQLPDLLTHPPLDPDRPIRDAHHRVTRVQAEPRDGDSYQRYLTNNFERQRSYTPPAPTNGISI